MASHSVRRAEAKQNVLLQTLQKFIKVYVLARQSEPAKRRCEALKAVLKRNSINFELQLINSD